MPLDRWTVGEVARISLQLFDTAIAPVDPGTLRLKVRNPVTKVVTTWTYGTGQIVRDSLGVYHADVLLSVFGTWYWRWESDAPNAGACEGSIAVANSIFN